MAIKPYKLKAFKSKYPYKQEVIVNTVIFSGSISEVPEGILSQTEGKVQPDDKFIIIYQK